LAAFDNGDPLSGPGELDGEGRTGLARTDDDAVEFDGHRQCTSHSGMQEIIGIALAGMHTRRNQ
jgi:hypothetical protein